MDILQEIENHLEWIESVAGLLTDETLAEENFKEITQHDQCMLGQWLNSEEALHLKEMPDFQQLIDSHEAFHQLAGNMIKSLQQGRESEAIENEAAFLQMSQELIVLLQMLQEHAQ